MPKPRAIGRLSYSNAHLLVVAFLLALAIWLIAKRDEVDTDNIEVLVDFRRVPGFLDVRSDPERVNVTLQFPRALRSEVIPANFRLTLDSSEINPARFAGTKDFRAEPYALKSSDLEAIDPRLPGGAFSVARFQPATIQVRARYIGRMATVVPRLAGTPQADHFLNMEKTVVRPAQVFVAGPQAVIDRLAATRGGRFEVDTEPIDISGVDGGVLRVADLDLPSGLQVVGDAPTVEVNVAIEPVRTTRTFPAVAVNLFALSSQVRVEIEPPTIAVEVEGPKTFLDQFTAEAFTVLTAAGTDLREEAGREYRDVPVEVRVRSSMPRAGDGVYTVRRIVPERVTVRYVAVEPVAPARD